MYKLIGLLMQLVCFSYTGYCDAYFYPGPGIISDIIIIIIIIIVNVVIIIP